MEEGEPSSWSAAAFISAIQQEDQQQEEQNGGHMCHKMAPAVSLPSIFTRGSYRRYMNYLIKSHSSEKLHIDSPLKTADAPLRDSRLKTFRGNVRSTHCMKRDAVITDKTSSRSHADCSSNLCNTNAEVEKPPVTPVPGGDNTNYVVGNLNSRVNRGVSLVSLSPVSSDMKGPVVLTNSVETDGGVVVDNKGDAPFLSSQHPSSSGRAIASQSDEEVDETLSIREKCNTNENNKGRQRKTGAVGGGRSRSAGAAQEANDTVVGASTALRFPSVEKLIHRYTAMITEQKERVMAEKQAENQSRGKHNEGNIENKFSNQCKEFAGNSSRNKAVPLQQKHSKQPTKPVQGRHQVTLRSSDLSQYSRLAGHVQHREFVINSDDNSLKQDDDLHGRTERSRKHLQYYPNEAVEMSAGELQENKFQNIRKLHKEEISRAHQIQCECDSDRVEHKTSHFQHRDGLDFVTECRVQRENDYRTLDLEEHVRQWDVISGPTGHNTKMHHRPHKEKGHMEISESEYCNNCVNKQHQLCEGNNKEETDGALQETSESVTSLFIKSSTHVTQNISHVGSTTASAIQDEGHHKLMLPRASQRSVSPASDEGCSVVPPPECGLTPCSSEGDIVKTFVEKPTARWTWPPESDDQDAAELEGRVHRHEYGRCGSSDSAVCLLPSDDERRLQMKDARLPLRKVSVDSDVLDAITSRDPSCDKTMVFDRYMRKSSEVSFDLDNLQHIWRHGSFSSAGRRDSDGFPDSVSRQNSVDRSDTWFEEIRSNTTEAVCEDLCDSGIDRGTFLGRTGDLCWDVSSLDAKTGDFSADDDRYRATAANVCGYPWKCTQRRFSKPRSMISCESGVVDDEDCSRKSSTAEAVDGDEYRVELRRQSAQSFQTDDEESSANSQYRYWRTPSVVVSDYSDDGPYFTSVTLEELEQLQDVSSSDCASAASSVSGSVGVSVGDAEYGLRTPERKASDCSTCSTLSGDEDASCDAMLQPLRTRQKVG